MILAAVEENAAILEFAADSLRLDKQFAVQAVARNGDALWHLPKKVQQQSEVIVAAVAKSGAVMKQEIEPIMGYYMEVLASSRRAVSEIRREERAARKEQAFVAEKHQLLLEQELDTLTMELEESKAINADLMERVAAYEAAAAVTESSSSDDEGAYKAKSVETPPASKRARRSDLFETPWEKHLLDAIDTSAREDDVDASILTSDALHLQCITTSALQAKVEELAALAIKAGADEDAVAKIKSRPLAVTTAN